MDFIKNPRAIEEKSMDLIDPFISDIDLTSEEITVSKDSSLNGNFSESQICALIPFFFISFTILGEISVAVI